MSGTAYIWKMSHIPEALPWYAVPEYVQFGVPGFSDQRDAIRICKAFDKKQISLWNHFQKELVLMFPSK